ncbi:hypothetical protein D9611_000905 [Ephemerocybe angulata]|uniref:SAP domain-containing protein n=1 Tax=Ephemerocybe angulata TaxID=980116 RepID=A0A8H5BPP9_9AGAR|nr:hypothetical protein D9611_000905 [Tulosesus angulatus]
MAPIAYAGALQPKKKSELQEIALALRISDQGTKDELQLRIKKHLDINSMLEENPQFAGLYGRRKRSVQPQLAPPTAVSEKPRSSSRIAGSLGLDPIRESTPAKDLRDVSHFLKHPPASPEQQQCTPQQSPRNAIDFGTPSSLPPLPETAPPSPAKSIVEAFASKPAEVRAAVQRFHEQEILPHGTEFLEATRQFLSNSRNIWTVTALFEVLYILYSVIPWRYAQIPLSAKGENSALSVPYPPLSTFQTSTFWLVLLHWAIPTLFAPALVGNLISFNPQPAPPSQQERNPSKGPTPTPIPFDPLTAAIVRVAASLAYPYASLSTAEHVYGLDVLGYNLRVFNSGVGLAFAFAEAIQVAPRSFATTLAHEQKLAIAPAPASSSREVFPTGRRARALMANGEESEGETPEVD